MGADHVLVDDYTGYIIRIILIDATEYLENYLSKQVSYKCRVSRAPPENLSCLWGQNLGSIEYQSSFFFKRNLLFLTREIKRKECFSLRCVPNMG